MKAELESDHIKLESTQQTIKFQKSWIKKEKHEVNQHLKEHDGYTKELEEEWRKHWAAEARLAQVEVESASIKEEAKSAQEALNWVWEQAIEDYKKSKF